jgi:hypothetical protein
MTRHIVVFIITFAVGAVVAVILRTATHKPYADPGGTAGPAGPIPAVAPGPATAAAATAAAATTPVNTTCPICAMPVNPALGTIAYKGRLVGFGCKACPSKFAAEPEKYGEAALKNQVVE